MRAVLQRVSAASVTVEDAIVGRIERGLLVYVGVAQADGAEDIEYLASKIAFLRIFPDETGKMNLDIQQIQGGVLAVSNFTLLADTRRGRRPDFIQAAAPAEAERMYEEFCERLRRFNLRVETGRFGAKMAVMSVNDGPINIVIDSRERG